MPDTGYNGWTNRETWLVNLWLSNDEPLYRGALAAVAEGLPLIDYTLHAIVDGRAGGMVRDMARDGLVTDALGRVDWPEIEKAWADG